MSNQEVDSRRKFKNEAKDSEDLRRRRNEVSVELRKAKKGDNLSKRRNMAEIGDQSSEEEDSVESTTTKQYSDDLSLDKMLAGIVQSTDCKFQQHCTKAVRRLLSKEKTPPINSVLDAGFGPYLVEFLKSDHNPHLQFEATWALTNIASGDSRQTRAVVALGAVTHFIRLLKSKHINVAEQAVWALGNIAGDGTELRDLVISEGCVQPLLELITTKITVVFLRNLTWTISNLCRNKNPCPPTEATNMIFPALAHLITNTDIEVVSDACWAISYLTDGTNERIQEVIDRGIVPVLVNILSNESDSKLLAPALRSIGNIVTGDDVQTQIVIDAGALVHLNRLLRHPKATIQKETAWTLSNIIAGNPSQISQVVDIGIIPNVLEVLKNGDLKAKKEAVWVITNLSSGGTDQHVSYLVEIGSLKPLCNMLESNDSRMISVVLESITNIFKIANKFKQAQKVADIIEECGGLDYIESLQHHESTHIYSQVSFLLETYYNDAEDEDEENEKEAEAMAPKINEKGEYEVNVDTSNNNVFSF